MARTIPPKRLRLGAGGAVKSINPLEKTAMMESGGKIRYKHLVSTMPVDGLLEVLESEDGEQAGLGEGLEAMREAAKAGLVYSNTIILGIGIRGVRPDRIGDKCGRSTTLLQIVECLTTT